MDVKEERTPSGDSLLPECHQKSKKRGSGASQKRCHYSSGASAMLPEVKARGVKRHKRKKSDLFQKQSNEDTREVAPLNPSPKSSHSPEFESKVEHSESPLFDDTRESSNSSQENNEMLSMSMLLKSILDKKKMILFESPEVSEFLKMHNFKQDD